MVTHEPDMAAYAKRIVRFVDGRSRATSATRRHGAAAPGEVAWMWLNTLLLALREIRRNLLRSFLTMLGIVIGVSAVITMVTLGNGATRSVQAQIASLGSNLLMVMPGQRLGPGGRRRAAVRRWPTWRRSPADRRRAPGGAGGAQQRDAGGQRPQLVGAGDRLDAELVQRRQLDDRPGRGFEPDEERVGAAVCVIGATVRKRAVRQRRPDRRAGAREEVLLHRGRPARQQGPGRDGQRPGQPARAAAGDHAAPRHRADTRINTILVSMNESADTDRLKAASSS